MPHIVLDITDQNGNVIGQIRLPHEEGGDGLQENEAPGATIDLQKVAGLLKEARKDAKG